MRIVTNLLPTHLFIPDEVAPFGAFKMPPRGSIEVPTVTRSLKDAERNGLVSSGAMAMAAPPKPEKVPEKVRDTPAPPAPEPGPAEPVEDLTSKVLVLMSQGKSQREIGEALGVSRNAVYNMIRRHRAAAAKE